MVRWFMRVFHAGLPLDECQSVDALGDPLEAGERNANHGSKRLRESAEELSAANKTSN
jgi:hypothetical protein